jgi:hypothetical protein
MYIKRNGKNNIISWICMSLWNKCQLNNKAILLVHLRFFRYLFCLCFEIDTVQLLFIVYWWFVSFFILKFYPKIYYVWFQIDTVHVCDWLFIQTLQKSLHTNSFVRGSACYKYEMDYIMYKNKKVHTQIPPSDLTLGVWLVVQSAKP